MNWTNFNTLADVHGFAVCYPMGVLNIVGNPFSGGSLMIGTADDVGFLTVLVLHL